ncbi:MAG: zf-HC2 domain-containing protein [Actinomycetota bacterium]
MGRLHQLRWGPLLELWLDGELAPDRVERVLAHLADCPDCAAEIETMARIKASLARLEVH